MRRRSCRRSTVGTQCRFPSTSLVLIATLTLLGVCSVDSNAQHATHGRTTHRLDLRVSCTAAAQVEFNNAITLLHHMTYPEARTSFQKVAVIDPNCAMAQWGIAMTLFQPLWPTRPNLDARRRGWEAAERGRQLPSSTEQERLLIGAVGDFFREPDSSDYWARMHRWEKSMEKAYQSFPDDTEIMAFYALAHLAVTPADKITRANADKAAEILLRVYQKNPGHPGAMHYLVHANDVPGRESQLLQITRDYESIAPENPHALHMPTHIYTRLGDWDGVVRGNLRAARAALSHPAGEHGEYIWDEFPHAMEYLVYAYLQKGDYPAAKTQLDRLRNTQHLEPTFKTAFHLTSTRSRFALDRHAWKEAAEIAVRTPDNLDWNRFTWPEAIARFARGLGAAHLKDLKTSRSESKKLEELERSTQSAGEELFARNIHILRLELDGWIEHVEKNNEAAIRLLRNAAELEASTPKHAVTPGPTIPAYELLGDMLSEQGQSAAALTAYERSLSSYPRRLNSLLGAARSARMLKNRKVASDFYRRVLSVTKGNRAPDAASREARAYLLRGR